MAIAVGVATGCGESRAPAPSGATQRTALTADELARLRAGLARLRPGMSRTEVFATLAVDLDRLGQTGTGPAAETTTIYVVGADQLDLTWDAHDQAHPVLLRAALIPRATH